MKILTFDTSSDKMYVTIGENNIVTTSKVVENTALRYHSALLIPTIIELLAKQKLTIQDIDAIGVNIGPGSFTGIRASAVTARIMAQNLDIPVIGVSSLEIFSSLNNTDKNSLCLLDAKKGKAYAGVYTPESDIIKTPYALEYDNIINYAQNNNFFIIADNIMSEKINLARFECINLGYINCDFGINLNKLTLKYLEYGNVDQYKWFNLKPLYIQPPPVTMPKIVKKNFS